MRCAVALAVLLAKPALGLCQPQTTEFPQTALTTTVENYALSENSFVEALTRVASRFKLPMGIEWTKDPSAHRPVNLSWKRTTIREVLESVVKSVPGYQFDFRDGVVHVHYPNSRADPHNFLNLHVESFELHDEFSFAGNRRLYELLHPIVSPAQTPSPGAGEAGDYATGVGGKRVTLRIKNVTAREVLDKLAMAGEFKVWVVTFSGRGKFTSTGFRRTQSLVNLFAITDDAQPIWDAVKWGDRVYVR